MRTFRKPAPLPTPSWVPMALTEQNPLCIPLKHLCIHRMVSSSQGNRHQPQNDALHGLGSPISFTMECLAFGSQNNRLFTMHLVELEALHLVWPNSSTLALPSFRDYICTFEIPRQNATMRFWFWLDRARLLIRTDALIARRQASNIQQIYSLASLLVFINANVNKGDVKSNKSRGQGKFTLDDGQDNFASNNRASNCPVLITLCLPQGPSLPIR